jgi:hypothetical protein
MPFTKNYLSEAVLGANADIAKQNKEIEKLKGVGKDVTRKIQRIVNDVIRSYSLSPEEVAGLNAPPFKEENSLDKLVITKPDELKSEMSQQSTFVSKIECVPMSKGLSNFNYQKTTSFENDVVAVRSVLGRSDGVALIFRNGYETPVVWSDGAIHFGVQKTKI